MFGKYKVRNLTKNAINQNHGGRQNSHKKCQKNSIDKSMIGAIINDIQNKKSCFQKLNFQYIHRSENSNAHKLAKSALDREENVYLIGVDLDRHVLAWERRGPRNPD